MFKATDNFKFALIIGFRTPQILIDKGQVLFDRRREVVVILDKITHSFPLEILHFINDDIYPLIQITFLFTLSSVQFTIKLQH